MIKPGNYWVVAYVTIIVEEGKIDKSLISEFLDDLEKNDPDSHAKVVAALERLAENGPPRNIEKFRMLEKGVFELKVSQCRLLNFRDDNFYIFTNGFRKKTDKAPPKEIKQSKKCHDNYVSKKQSNLITCEPYQEE